MLVVADSSRVPQNLVPRSTLFISYADANIEPEFNLWTKDWSEVRQAVMCYIAVVRGILSDAAKT